MKLHFSALTRPVRALLAAGASGAIAACGGGIYYYDDDYDGVPPEVSIAAPAQARAGETVRLSAAAVDDWSGVDRVAFYRIDGNAALLLGTDVTRPYEWSMVIPTDGRTVVEVFAWARDREGNSADSAVARITIVP